MPTPVTIMPVPDPSTLTTAALRREVDVLQRELGNVQKLLEGRLDAIDRATVLRMERVEGIPSDTREKVSHLREVQDERFTSIAQQFSERDIRTSQASDASAQALAAALQAAKELVGAQGEASAAAAVKSETSFTKQIDQIGTIIQTLEKALDARITELKERIDRGEGNQTGVHDQRLESRANTGQFVAAMGVAAVVASLVLTFILDLISKG